MVHPKTKINIFKSIFSCGVNQNSKALVNIICTIFFIISANEFWIPYYIKITFCSLRNRSSRHTNQRFQGYILLWGSSKLKMFASCLLFYPTNLRSVFISRFGSTIFQKVHFYRKKNVFSTVFGYLKI